MRHSDKKTSPGNTAKCDAKSSEFILCSSPLHVRNGAVGSAENTEVSHVGVNSETGREMSFLNNKQQANKTNHWNSLPMRINKGHEKWF